jgi:hypothetical protein
MADEAGGTAVVEAPISDVNGEPSANESTELTSSEQPKPEQSTEDKQDGRKQPDALRKRIAELRRQADSIADPVAKKALLDDAKELNNRIGKVGAYEELFPTVREAREFKALLDTVGGRDGFAQIQETLSNVEQIDGMLERGDPAVLDALWEEAKQGMPRLVPAIIERFAKENPQEYAKAITPHAVRFFDDSGFPEAFDQMVAAFKGGDTKTGESLALRMAQWFASQRQGAQAQPQANPEQEKWEREKTEWEQKQNDEKINAAYNSVVEHAGPVIDKFLKPIVAKLGLSAEQYGLLREDVWADLQKTRNADPTYKTVANAKFKQGIEPATAYIKGETEARAEQAASRMAKLRYGHQLKNGAVARVNPIAPVAGPSIVRGKEPAPSEIDYGPKGVQAARKAGFKDLADMILSGRAPMKSGGVRQWR